MWASLAFREMLALRRALDDQVARYYARTGLM